MVIKVNRVKSKKINCFMTDEEAQILWQWSKRFGLKMQAMMGLALFRGMRIGEITATNIYDFQNDNFEKLSIILQKSHILDEFPILKGFDEMLKEYVIKNLHLFKDGYLFPSHLQKWQHIDTKVAVWMFCELRIAIGKEHKQFLDRREIINSKSKTIYRYRITWHSCRRWFETRIWERYKDKMMLRDIMRYKESKTVDVYINPYEVWKREGEILNSTFGSLFKDFNNISRGQMKITSWVNDC